MKLAELAKKAAKLPDCKAFGWPGAEHYSDMNFEGDTQNPDDLRNYVDKLRKRMGEYSLALEELGSAYRQMRDLLLSFDVERDDGH
jgi:hypothetical protein